MTNKVQIDEITFKSGNKIETILIPGKSVFFGKNKSGKSVLAGGLVRPFGLNANLSGDAFTEAGTSIDLKFTYLNKVYSVAWYSGMKHSYTFNGGDSLKSESLGHELQNIGFPLTNDMCKLLGVSLWSQTFAPQSFNIKSGLVPELGYQQNDYTYSLWANSITDWQKFQNLINEKSKLRNQIKQNEAEIKTKQLVLDEIKRYSIDGFEDDEQQILDRIDNLLIEIDQDNINLMRLYSEQEFLKIILKPVDEFKALSSIFDNRFIKIDEIKITFADFLEHANFSNPEYEAMYLKVKDKIAEIRVNIRKNTLEVVRLKNQIKELVRGKSILVKNGLDEILKTIDVKSTEIGDISKLLLEIDKQINPLDENIKTEGELFYNSIKAKHDLKKINDSGPLRYFKIRTNTETGWEAALLWLDANLYASEKNGQLMPFVIDSIDEYADHENIDVFIDYIVKLSVKNQVIVTTHKLSVFEKLKAKGFFAKEISLEKILKI